MTALVPTTEGARPTEANNGSPSAVKNLRVRTTPLSWQGHTDLSCDEWEKAGLKLGGASRSTSWWIGDWLRFGKRYGDRRYTIASRITGYEEKTLRNFSVVAGKFDPRRRRSALTWSHHAEVAGLNPDDQERWLNEAEARKLTVTALRERVNRETAATASSTAVSVNADARDDVNGADGEPLLLCPDCSAPLTLVGGALRRVPISGQMDIEHAHEHKRPR